MVVFPSYLQLVSNEISFEYKSTGNRVNSNPKSIWVMSVKSSIICSLRMPLILILIANFGFLSCSSPPSAGPSPTPTGGVSTILLNTIYPEEAREAGIEGTVIVRTFIDPTGEVTQTVVVKGFPNTGLDEAAVKGIRKTSWQPASQVGRHGKPIGVWVDIPVTFRLEGPFFDEPPVPIGGYSAIAKNIIYSRIARQYRIEGTVVVHAYVDNTGKVIETFMLSGIPRTGLDESAMGAIKQTRFEPAKYKGKAVGVWFPISVNFRLYGLNDVRPAYKQ